MNLRLELQSNYREFLFQSTSDTGLVLKLIDDCHLQEGELSQALEFVYHNDPNGMREELRRRGIHRN